uniref:Uncharacterized protein n=1 Tax=Zea mays TaxID=4577 RepID=B6UC85_MAIZE|nr:hypothetical protein [Zea mays]
MGPGLYSDIGRKARDLLTGGFNTGQQLVLITHCSNGTRIAASSTKSNEFIISEIQAQLKMGDAETCGGCVPAVKRLGR